LIRPKLSLRRPLAVLGAALVGLTGAVAVSAPASAHHTTITATADCDKLSGERVITWTVVNSETDKAATLQQVTPNPKTAVIVAVEGAVPAALEGAVIPEGGSVQAVQRVPGDTTSATLSVYALWKKNGKDNTSSGSIDLSRDGACSPAPTCVELDQATYSHTFDGPKGTATVKLNGERPLCGDRKQWFTLISYFAPRPQFATPQYVYGTPDSNWIGGTQTEIELKVELPDCNTQVDLIWGDKDEVIDPLVEGGKRYNDKKLGSPGAPGNRSRGPQGWYNGGSKTCATPASAFTSSCDGSVTVSLSNDGKISKYPVEFEVKGENGWSKKVTVEPGKADKSTVVPAANAGKIEVLVDGKVIEKGTYSWQRPEDCPLPVVTTDADCKSFTLTVANPEGGLPVKVELSYGGQSETRTVAPGGSEKVTFKAGKAESAKIVLPDLEMEMDAIYAPEEDCSGGGGAGGPDLPKTGAAAGVIAAGAAILLAAGAALFVVARRRRIRFTA
jgi:LPXTG-motif cell wall-anchored protein